LLDGKRSRGQAIDAAAWTPAQRSSAAIGCDASSTTSSMRIDHGAGGCCACR
jgi:hypothetical protein